MTAVAASHPLSAELLTTIRPGTLRHWLGKVLFLHLDLWPWELTCAPGRMFAMSPNESRGSRHGSSGNEEPTSAPRFQHKTVLLHEAVNLLQPAPGKLFV